MHTLDTDTALARVTTPRTVELDFDPSIFQDAQDTILEALDDPRGPLVFLGGLFRRFPVVFGVIPHPTRPNTFTTEVLQGAGVVARIMTGEVSDVRTTSWHCADVAELQRIRADFSRDSHYDREKLRKLERKGMRLSISSVTDRPPVPAELRALAELSNANLAKRKLAEARGENLMAFDLAIAAACDVLYVLFLSNQGCGLGSHVVKGKELIGVPGVRVDAVSASSKEQAVALALALRLPPAPTTH